MGGVCVRQRVFLRRPRFTGKAGLLEGSKRRVAHTREVAQTADPPKGSLTVKTSAILGVVWAGVFGWNASVAYLLPSELFVLLLCGLAVGFVLTVVVLQWTLALAKMNPAGSKDVSMLR